MSLINRLINPTSTRGASSLFATDPYSLMNQQLAMMQRTPLFDTAIEASMVPFDVKETPKEFIIHADVPGFSKEQIRIDTENNVLNIRGSWEKSKEEENAKEEWWFKERSRSSFQRSIPLSSPFDASKITAEMSEGVLMIQVPKTMTAPAKKIHIK